MDEPGQKLKHARERLSLRYRDVEEASNQIATRHSNDEFIIALSRLSDIENKGTVPSLFRLYSLCTIYRLDIHEVLEWYGVDLSSQAVDAASIEIKGTHPIRFGARSYGDVQMPLSLDPGLDIRKTTFLSQMIQRWGTLPLSLVSGADGKHLRFAFVGSEDWSMYPLIRPESLLLIDDTQRKIASSGWSNEFDRPVYFVEHRTGYFIGWCISNEKHFIILPHPASQYQPQIFLPGEVDILGQVTGVAMHLDHAKRRNTPA
jgi:transcriptional regulator with XRE-family HTH domain